MSATVAPFLTVPQLARRIGRDPHTVRRWFRLGLVKGAIRTESGQFLMPIALVDKVFQPTTSRDTAGSAEVLTGQ